MRIIRAVNDNCKKLAGAYLFSASFTGVAYGLRPFLLNLVNFGITYKEFSYEMPMKSSFFYDVSKSPAYELSCLTFFFGSFAVVTMSVSQVN